MQKNIPQQKHPIEIDTATGDYLIRIPEWVINDQNWFEDTELTFKTDGDELIITESED